MWTGEEKMLFALTALAGVAIAIAAIIIWIVIPFLKGLIG